jgi:hypothetical protein
VRRVDLGSVPDWVNAAGTLLAFCAALFAGVVAVRSYKSQQQATDRQLAIHTADEHRREQNERQWQASKVAIWVHRSRRNWVVSAANNSGLPVYRLTVRVSSADPTFSVAIERGTQGPGAAEKSHQLTNALRVILAQRKALDMDPNELHVAIAFTDATGVRWRRDARGRLEEVPDSFDFDDVEERLIDRLIPEHDPRDRQGLL